MVPQRLIFGLLALALAMVMAPAAVADEGHSVSLTVEAKESGCADTYCWEVDGDTDSIDAGATVEITVRNPSSNSANHNLFVKEGSGSQGGTDAGSNLLASTDDLAPGEEETINFTVPDDASELYYWCDVAGHESLGMAGSWSISSDGGDGTDGTDGTDGGGADGNDSNGDTQDAPGPALLMVLAMISLAAVARTRQR